MVMLYSYAERRWKPILPILHHHLPIFHPRPNGSTNFDRDETKPKSSRQVLMNICFWKKNVLVYEQTIRIPEITTRCHPNGE